ncbi:hypothetical protein [Limnospira platensis]|uniref:hypothetical protein n=2 Tax=Limnospira TaxID=2596745 RepID=UPI000903E31C|nr:hypothetical protein [Arthrospira platensis NCB002]WAK73886.1 hypothetical protein AP9108_35870 [Arthrospira sp. PCC 9108]MDF2209592.1 hypothetical protein [Arthrospira platensis NCB002]MDF2212606.1 hypothetical protein [Arthrospira platensis NCB002]WAK74516.1 hypothetical protein AP9108_34200 [Arthrospira sp. PCC 9108]
MSAACQPLSLLNSYDGSSRTFGFPNHGWLAVVSFLVLGYTSEPSVPRFSPGFVIPKTGGGYRRYPQLCFVISRYVKDGYELLQSILTLGFLP